MRSPALVLALLWTLAPVRPSPIQRTGQFIGYDLHGLNDCAVTDLKEIEKLRPEPPRGDIDQEEAPGIFHWTDWEKLKNLEKELPEGPLKEGLYRALRVLATAILTYSNRRAQTTEADRMGPSLLRSVGAHARNVTLVPLTQVGVSRASYRSTYSPEGGKKTDAEPKFAREMSDANGNAKGKPTEGYSTPPSEHTAPDEDNPSEILTSDYPSSTDYASTATLHLTVIDLVTSPPLYSYPSVTSTRGPTDGYTSEYPDSETEPTESSNPPVTTGSGERPTTDESWSSTPVDSQQTAQHATGPAEPSITAIQSTTNVGDDQYGVMIVHTDPISNTGDQPEPTRSTYNDLGDAESLHTTPFTLSTTSTTPRISDSTPTFPSTEEPTTPYYRSTDYTPVETAVTRGQKTTTDSEDNDFTAEHASSPDFITQPDMTTATYYTESFNYSFSTRPESTTDEIYDSSFSEPTATPTAHSSVVAVSATKNYSNATTIMDSTPTVTVTTERTHYEGVTAGNHSKIIANLSTPSYHPDNPQTFSTQSQFNTLPTTSTVGENSELTSHSDEGVDSIGTPTTRYFNTAKPTESVTAQTTPTIGESTLPSELTHPTEYQTSTTPSFTGYTVDTTMTSITTTIYHSHPMHLTEPTVSTEITTEPAVSTQISTEPAVSTQITTEPAISTQVTTEPTVSTQIATEPADTQISTESAVSDQITNEPAVSTQVTTEPTVSTQIATESTVSTHVTPEPAVSTQITTESAVSTQITTEPAVSTQVTTEPTVSTHVTTEPAVSTQVTAEPTVSTHVTTEPVVSTQITTEPAISTHVTTEPTVSTHVTTEPAVSTQVTTESAISTHFTTEPAVSTQITTESAVSTQITTEPTVSTAPEESTLQASTTTEGATTVSITEGPAYGSSGASGSGYHDLEPVRGQTTKETTEESDNGGSSATPRWTTSDTTHGTPLDGLNSLWDSGKNETPARNLSTTLKSVSTTEPFPDRVPEISQGVRVTTESHVKIYTVFTPTTISHHKQRPVPKSFIFPLGPPSKRPFKCARVRPYEHIRNRICDSASPCI